MGAKRPLRSWDKRRIGLTPYFRCQIGCKGTKNILNIQRRKRRRLTNTDNYQEETRIISKTKGNPLGLPFVYK